MPTEDTLPNLVTIVGRGVPSNYELSVEGRIRMVGANPAEEATIVSDRAAEGTIDTGVQRFRFSGELANVRLVDWNGASPPESPDTPTVHIDYNVPDR
ncbi:hypothetical protein [Natrononativus amylolyticus]|uniref:hypothetical protein n=1 Tax=Natrononativus amylolyticus TaxID=2963434 RepID=UPI0020CEAF85|nr:hypothetical protein [Natrononativus amylolyticus]